MDPLHARPWQLGSRGRRWFDVTLALGLLGVGLLGHVISGQLVAAVLTAVQTVPLVRRRTHPWPVFLTIAAASALQAVLVDTPIVGQLAFPIAVYSVARWAPRWQGVTALLVGYAGAGVASVRWITAFDTGKITAGTLTPYVVTIAAIVTTAWALGFAGQQRERYVAALVERAELAERTAEREVQLAAQDERARIAREMHDVVAHGLSVIVVQADGAGYAAAKDPQVALDTLGRIGATGRESLTEMRRLLGLLRSGDSGVRPQPGLADVAHLVTDTRTAGTRVEADLPDPWPVVSDGVGLAAYRIVQEALTNVRKHAGPSAGVTVRVGVQAGAVEIEVHDDGRGAAAGSDGGGLGLLGMRERAESRGGTLTAGPAAGGGFAVSARIPL
ncbi:sensor histidine kinase [Nocardioides currus]|uniref:histidine kinase n=1 Tax=Nocardioides currus TaxID=2133958 RepID=A0A2R7Z3J4_9ACTN|nr:histidine kinase [Nocardioides currus]PUA82856.1 two-component sensor histidine kinase [Nocardioides currus]